MLVESNLVLSLLFKKKEKVIEELFTNGTCSMDDLEMGNNTKVRAKNTQLS